MIEEFKTPNLKASSRKLIEQANEIITQYQVDGIQLTLRQLYYQFIARNWLANTFRNYKNLGYVVSEGRLAGLIDWSALDDLSRVPSIPSFSEDLDSFIENMRDMGRAFVLDPWADQDFYVELHVEKMALSSVLGPIAEQFGIGFSMNRGYSSQTAFYDASKRFIEARENGKECVCLYCGDHDPSGEDMMRDFADRMRMFGADVEIRKVALTIEQVRHYKCPPNPAKQADPRAKAYIEKFGRHSWEIDALEPKALRRIVSKAVAECIDKKRLERLISRQERDRKTIERALSRIA